MLRRHHRPSVPSRMRARTTGAKTAEEDDVVDYTVKDAQPGLPRLHGGVITDMYPCCLGSFHPSLSRDGNSRPFVCP